MIEPRYSILLPTHDRADVVGYAVRSVLGQTEQDFELLVVGDGCTDETGSVVLAFDDPRIRWFDLPKAPHFGYANRNLALREARGELIAYMAHDDLLLPDHLERLSAPFADPDVEWAYSRPMWISDDGILVPFVVDLRDHVQLKFFLEVANSIPATCVVHRKACLDRYGFWPEDVPSAGDWEYWKTIIRPSGGANMAYVSEATTLHFRASWRDPGRWGPAPLHQWLEIADQGRSWPRPLQVALSAGEPPQASVLRVIEDRPEQWTAAMRKATLEATDLVAWTQARQLDRLYEELQQARAEAETWRQEAGASAARAEAAATAAEAATVEARRARTQLDSLLSSKSWRLTAPLRSVWAALRR